LAILGTLHLNQGTAKYDFEAYKLQYTKHYSKSESAYRLTIFLKNVALME